LCKSWFDGFSSTENAKNYFAAEKYSITNPTGWDGVKKYYSHQLRLSSSRDGVPWGMVNAELGTRSFFRGSLSAPNSIFFPGSLTLMRSFF
jgi:hypothetical protein